MTFLVNKNARGRVSAKVVPNFKYQIFLGILKLILMICIGVLLWYVTRLDFLTIKNVVVSGGETISHHEISLRVQDELNGTYFLIIPKRFSYFFPHDRILNVLKKNSRMYNIEVVRTAHTELSISFDEYIPHALWCIENSDTHPCYFLTSDGFAFAEAPLLTGGTLLRHEIEGLTEISKGEVITKTDLGHIDLFIQKVNQELGFRISRIIHTRDNDIRLMINGGGMIIIAKGKDFGETFDNLKSVLLSKEFQHIKPGNFQYIDARFGNKIFVNEVMATSSQELPNEFITLPE